MSGLFSILLFTSFFSGMLLAANTSGQSIREVKVSLEFEEASLSQVFAAIEKATEFEFLMDPGIDQRKDKFTFDAKNESVAFILEKVSLQTGLSFKQLNGTILVHIPKYSGRKKNVNSKSSRDKIIRGKVTDGNGEPLAGASILIKGTVQGTISDIEGNYVLEVPEGAAILSISYVGYSTQEVIIGERSIIDVILTIDVTSLNEVVVSTGYWETSERLNTGNIGKIEATVIEQQSVVNPLQTLQGRIAGVQIQETSGVPGSEININIRGVNSLNNGQQLDDGTFLPNANRPFYVIDGVPFTNTSVNGEFTFLPMGEGNPLSTLQPSDIESIEILKDADATAIYGSRGANGVVLITTKKGKAGRTSVDINYSRGWGEIANKVDLLNTEQYLEMRWEGLRNDGETPNEIAYPDLLVWDTTRYTDWQKELIGGIADQTNTSLAISGGNEQTKFVFRGNYFQQGNVYNYDDSRFERGSGHISINHASKDRRFNINFSTNYSVSFNNQNGVDATRTALTLEPNAPALFDSLGNLNWENSTWENPLATFEEEYENTTKNLVANAELSYRILDKLEVSSSLGHTSTTVDEIRLTPISSSDPFNPNLGSSTFGNGNADTWIIEPKIRYDTDVSKGKLSVLIGSSFQGSNENSETREGRGYNNDVLLKDIFAAESIFIIGTRNAEYRYSAIYSRINFSWQDKYILNVTGRRDGSSRFGPGNQFGNFGALGSAWLFSEENFVKNIFPALSFGKLRGSYGVVGSDQIGDYQYLSSFVSGEAYDGEQVLIPSRAANPDYSWETTRKLEFGLELGLLQDRIQLNTSWYRNRTFDQLIGRPLTATTGFTSQQFNLPATVENRGWEFEMNTINMKSGSFQWLTSFNITIPQNELTEFSEIEQFPAFNALYEVGQPILGRKQYQSLGVNPETGEYDFVDFNRDGVINTLDRRYFVPNIQEYYGGLNNTFRFKGLQVDVFLHFVKQDAPSFLNFFDGAGSVGIATTRVLDRWQNPGDVTDIQRFSDNLNVSQNRYESSNQEDASYIRLQNVSISWNLPTEWLKQTKLSNVRLYAQGRYLFTITDYDGLDPESLSTSLPPLRMINTGVQVTF